MNINLAINALNNFLWQWPMIVFVAGAALIITVYLRGIQFTHFLKAWKLLFTPTSDSASSSDMSPLQAFMNTLSASIGNGSIAGMATAIYSGGPGAAVWLFIFGFFAMALRFSEVYLSTAFGVKRLSSGSVGGPLVYLSHVPGGRFLPYVYAFILFVFSCATGSAMQSNSIGLGCVSLFGIQKIVVALILLVLMSYIMFGGAQRIVKFSTALVPLKVGCFLITAIYALVYHAPHLLPALKLMINSAFGWQAVSAGALGYSVQQALRYGLVRGVNACEAGLGTASILFGGASTKQPVRSGILSMLSAFFTSNLVCFSVMLIIVASGVWNNGQTSIDLTISAYQTVFGALGAWIVTLLAIMFGLGTIIAYAYIARCCWTFLTNGKYLTAFNIIFILTTVLGCLAKVDLIWNATDLINAALLLTNLYGVLYLLPTIGRALRTAKID